MLSISASLTLIVFVKQGENLFLIIFVFSVVQEQYIKKKPMLISCSYELWLEARCRGFFVPFVWLVVVFLLLFHFGFFYLLTEFCCWPILCWLSKFSPRKLLSCTKSKGHGWKTPMQDKIYRNVNVTQEIHTVCMNTDKILNI